MVLEPGDAAVNSQRPLPRGACDLTTGPVTSTGCRDLIVGVPHAERWSRARGGVLRGEPSPLRASLGLV